MNSLSAITAEHGIDGDEQDEALWDQIRDWRGDDVRYVQPWRLLHVPLTASCFYFVSWLPSLLAVHSQILIYLPPANITARSLNHPSHPPSRL